MFLHIYKRKIISVDGTHITNLISVIHLLSVILSNQILNETVIFNEPILKWTLKIF